MFFPFLSRKKKDVLIMDWSNSLNDAKLASGINGLVRIFFPSKSILVAIFFSLSEYWCLFII